MAGRRSIMVVGCVSLLLLLSGCGHATGGGGTTGTATGAGAGDTGGGTLAPTGTESPGSAPGGCPPPTGDSYARAVLADHPAVYYRLDETPGQALCDASTSHNAGMYSASGITYRSPGALRSTGDTAISADGSAGVATSGADTGISGPSSFTLEAWFQATTRQDEMALAIGQAVPQNMAGVGPWADHLASPNTTTTGSGDYICFDTYSGAFQFDASPLHINVFDGRWHYVAVAYSAGSGTATAYLDGRTIGSTQIADQPAASSLRIGYWVDTFFNKPFNGGLDEVAVYPSALTGEQIAHHYAAAV